MADTIGARFAGWLKTARTEAALSQQNVADALRAQGAPGPIWHQTVVAKIERGERPLRLDEAVALAVLFGTTVDAALGLTGAPEQSAATQALVRRTSALQQIQALVVAELGGEGS